MSADLREHLGALEQRLAAAAPTLSRVDPGVDSTNLPNTYVTLHVSERYAGDVRPFGGQREARFYRIVADVAATTRRNALWALAEVDRAFRDHPLYVLGDFAGQVSCEMPGDMPRLTERRFYAASTWIY